MAREGGAGAAVVAPLLQERFRQLQRMKELREEKELLMRLMFYTPPSLTTTTTRPSTCNYYELLSAGNHMMFLPPKPHCKLSLSLWPAADCRRTNKAPSDLSTLCFATDKNSASDIDTSLHL